MPESQNYVTNGHLNTVVYEIKTEIRDVRENAEKKHSDLKHNNELLQTTLLNLNNSIDKNTAVMDGIVKELEKSREDIQVIKHENISRDYILKDLEDFKVETSGKLSSSFSETVKLVGIIGGIFGTIIVAIINIAPALFG